MAVRYRFAHAQADHIGRIPFEGAHIFVHELKYAIAEKEKIPVHEIELRDGEGGKELTGGDKVPNNSTVVIKRVPSRKRETLHVKAEKFLVEDVPEKEEAVEPQEEEKRPLPAEYLCPLCHNPYRDAVQVKCEQFAQCGGKSACRKCVDEYVKKHRSCPFCSSGFRGAIPNKALRDAMNKLDLSKFILPTPDRLSPHDPSKARGASSGPQGNHALPTQHFPAHQHDVMRPSPAGSTPHNGVFGHQRGPSPFIPPPPSHPPPPSSPAPSPYGGVVLVAAMDNLKMAQQIDQWVIDSSQASTILDLFKGKGGAGRLFLALGLSVSKEGKPSPYLLAAGYGTLREQSDPSRDSQPLIETWCQNDGDTTGDSSGRGGKTVVVLDWTLKYEFGVQIPTSAPCLGVVMHSQLATAEGLKKGGGEVLADARQVDKMASYMRNTGKGLARTEKPGAGAGGGGGPLHPPQAPGAFMHSGPVGSNGYRPPPYGGYHGRYPPPPPPPPLPPPPPPPPDAMPQQPAAAYGYSGPPPVSDEQLKALKKQYKRYWREMARRQRAEDSSDSSSSSGDSHDEKKKSKRRKKRKKSSKKGDDAQQQEGEAASQDPKPETKETTPNGVAVKSEERTDVAIKQEYGAAVADPGRPVSGSNPRSQYPSNGGGDGGYGYPPSRGGWGDSGGHPDRWYGHYPDQRGGGPHYGGPDRHEWSSYDNYGYGGGPAPPPSHHHPHHGYPQHYGGRGHGRGGGGGHSRYPHYGGSHHESYRAAPYHTVA
ncbi:unnamed protein product [Vitrella brassicaformis CCMP3155]|uniref:RING-type domain-containing protein n=2 Tax=Vitrella brassicaformis TaxID=1169539 RepID=A0A0G4EDK0_VITBC|nr:unnamed protein product [Vitrella brassicaformis CCMP3155]|eukprot:CEL93585.1 unnamed protein product [Vitrella brassicaformis CCMP3155]